jgi:hypothetical protein
MACRDHATPGRSLFFIDYQFTITYVVHTPLLIIDIKFAFFNFWRIFVANEKRFKRLFYTNNSSKQV